MRSSMKRKCAPASRVAAMPREGWPRSGRVAPVGATGATPLTRPACQCANWSLAPGAPRAPRGHGANVATSANRALAKSAPGERREHQPPGLQNAAGCVAVLPRYLPECFICCPATRFSPRLRFSLALMPGSSESHVVSRRGKTVSRAFALRLNQSKVQCHGLIEQCGSQGRNRGCRLPKEPTMSDVLRAAIRASGQTHYRISKNAGIAPDYLHRFVHGSRDIRLTTAGKICKALGLELRKKDA